MKMIKNLYKNKLCFFGLIVVWIGYFIPTPDIHAMLTAYGLYTIGVGMCYLGLMNE